VCRLCHRAALAVRTARCAVDVWRQKSQRDDPTDVPFIEAILEGKQIPNLSLEKCVASISLRWGDTYVARISSTNGTFAPGIAGISITTDNAYTGDQLLEAGFSDTSALIVNYDAVFQEGTVPAFLLYGCLRAAWR
jgi:hypothetical protein